MTLISCVSHVVHSASFEALVQKLLGAGRSILLYSNFHGLPILLCDSVKFFLEKVKTFSLITFLSLVRLRVTRDV